MCGTYAEKTHHTGNSGRPGGQGTGEGLFAVRFPSANQQLDKPTRPHSGNVVGLQRCVGSQRRPSCAHERTQATLGKGGSSLWWVCARKTKQSTVLGPPPATASPEWRQATWSAGLHHTRPQPINVPWLVYKHVGARLLVCAPVRAGRTKSCTQENSKYGS